MKRQRCLTHEERQIWARFTAQLTPLKGVRPLPLAPDPTAANPASASTASGHPGAGASIVPHRPGPPTVPQAALLQIGSAPGGLDRSSWQRLRSGRIAVDRKLDLHGLTAQNAYLRFEQVLQQAASGGLRCLEVVTGRGSGHASGVIRRELPLWLNLPHLRPLVLAACHPHEANNGAVRLLLRRSASQRHPAR